jgi:hypothetical protein
VIWTVNVCFLVFTVLSSADRYEAIETRVKTALTRAYNR